MHQIPDDLTALERQLAACQPASAGLDTDAMLFAAGRAAARHRGPGSAWPALACGFTVLSAVLGTGMIRERSERLTLLAKLVRQPMIVVESTPPIAAASPPGPDSYLTIRRLVERDADAWLAHSDHGPEASPSPSDSPPILHAWPANSTDLQP